MTHRCTNVTLYDDELVKGKIHGPENKLELPLEAPPEPAKPWVIANKLLLAQLGLLLGCAHGPTSSSLVPISLVHAPIMISCN